MMSSAELLASKLILRVILSDQWLMCLLISISIITNQKDPFQAVSKFLMLKLIIIKGPPDFAYFLILYLSLYIVLSFSSSIWGCFTIYIYIYIKICMQREREREKARQRWRGFWDKGIGYWKRRKVHVNASEMLQYIYIYTYAYIVSIKGFTFHSKQSVL